MRSKVITTYNFLYIRVINLLDIITFKYNLFLVHVAFNRIGKKKENDSYFNGSETLYLTLETPKIPIYERTSSSNFSCKTLEKTHRLPN